MFLGHIREDASLRLHHSGVSLVRTRLSLALMRLSSLTRSSPEVLLSNFSFSSRSGSNLPLNSSPFSVLAFVVRQPIDSRW